MLGSGILNVAIGLAFIFGVTAALSSVFTELIARFLGLRAAYLLRGLRELLDNGKMTTELTKAEGDYNAWQKIMKGTPPPAGPEPEPGKPQPAEAAAGDGLTAEALAKIPSATGALLGSPILRGQGMTGSITSRALTLPAAEPGRPAPLPKGPLKFRRSLPAYIPATSFADALIDLLVPNAGGQTTLDAIDRSLASLKQELPVGSPLVASLQALSANANGSIARFRLSVENWYDGHMDRVSGWYKRRTATITLVVGAILVLLLNINALTIGRTLYSSSVISNAVSSVAVKTTSCPPGESAQKCLGDLQAQLSAATQAGLPIGWTAVTDCAAPNIHCNWLDRRGIFSRHGGSPWQVVLIVIGFLITIIALTPGARFWFDLLSKLGSLRSTGPKPAS